MVARVPRLLAWCRALEEEEKAFFFFPTAHSDRQDESKNADALRNRQKKSVKARTFSSPLARAGPSSGSGPRRPMQAGSRNPRKKRTAHQARALAYVIIRARSGKRAFKARGSLSAKENKP